MNLKEFVKDKKLEVIEIKKCHRKLYLENF